MSVAGILITFGVAFVVGALVRHFFPPREKHPEVRSWPECSLCYFVGGPVHGWHLSVPLACDVYWIHDRPQPTSFGYAKDHDLNGTCGVALQYNRTGPNQFTLK